jgi:NADPH:quinone reductase-like Zn-dependent oxidoreductase
MDNLAEIIKNLTPEKRAQLLARLGKNNGEKKADASKTEFSTIDNYAYRFRSQRPFDFEREEVTITPPDPGFVQIEVKAASLNFRDLMIALGLYPSSPGVPSNMGSDYSGVVIKVGEGVQDYKVGDEIIGLSIGHFENGIVRENCHFIKKVNISTNCIVPKPVTLNHEQACCIPTVFLTSYVGLIHMAKLSKDDTVLLHTATGGVGLAAIQVAKWVGARIFATAGSVAKREYLATLGIDNAMDSRSLLFESQIMEMTNGSGVDVILNTLSADAVEAGLRLLRSFGRFVHIDKKDIAANRPLPMGLFQNGISFFYLDISLLFRQQELMQAQLREIVAHFDAGHFKPINLKTYAMADIKKAFNDFSHANHIGKLVLIYD